MTHVNDAQTIPERTLTVACQIDRHSLCSGTGTHVDTGDTVKCDCSCHVVGRVPAK